MSEHWDDRLTTEIYQVLQMAAKIVGKVVADDLMPNIVAPDFPEMVDRRIQALLAKIEGK